MSEPITLAADGFSIVLSRVADRYRHEVLLTTGETRVVLASLEGTDDQAWPPSPAFQELHTQSTEGIDAVLLVGRAGRSHWSASIELDRSRQIVLFDIACRSSGPSEWLGSRYRCLVDRSGAAVAEGRALLFASNLQVDVLEGEAHVSDENQTPVLSIAPQCALPSRLQTIRWKYRIGRTGSRLSG